MLGEPELKAMVKRVCDDLEPGYAEEVYKQALLVELRLADWEYDRERAIPIYYQGRHCVGFGQGDIVVRGKKNAMQSGTTDFVVVEGKKTAGEKPAPEDIRQTRRYMKSLISQQAELGKSGINVAGYLVYFGNQEPEKQVVEVKLVKPPTTEATAGV